mgnify:FL=1
MAIKHLEEAGRTFSGRNGLYVHAKVSAVSSQFLMQLARELALPVGTDRQMKLHCTVMWSKVPPHTPRAENRGYRGEATFERLEFWKGHDKRGYVVAILDSPDLKVLHDEWGERGCSHSFADYTPHVTLADDLELTDTIDLCMRLANEKYKGYPVNFYGEYMEDLKS